MKKFILAAVAVAGLGLSTMAVRAADSAKEGSWNGVLIDNACGAKQKDETAAAKHPVSCSLKESCSASGYQLIVGDKHYKLDDKGNEQAKAYLEKEKAEKGANKVTITGKLEGEKIEVTSIKAAEGHGGEGHGKSSKSSKQG